MFYGSGRLRYRNGEGGVYVMWCMGQGDVAPCCGIVNGGLLGGMMLVGICFVWRINDTFLGLYSLFLTKILIFA